MYTTGHTITNMSNKRQRVIEEAYKLFYRNGYNGVGVNEIVTAAEVPKGSFYYYFKTKENLAVETVRHYQKIDLTAQKLILTDTKQHPLQRIAQIGEMRLTKYEQEFNYKLGCYAGNMALEMGDVSIPMQQALDDYFTEYQQILVACLHDAQEGGFLSELYDVNEFAAFMIDSFEGALVRMKTAGSVEPLRINIKMISTFFNK